MIDKETVLQTLRAHQAELQAMGVRHIALFGSVARGEADENSDIDLLVDLDPDRKISVFDYVGVIEHCAKLFPAKVDVANARTLKARVRQQAEQDFIHAF
jgi:predicted nucleotidyltransferase